MLIQFQNMRGRPTLGGTAEIRALSGASILIDEEDFANLSRYRWSIVGGYALTKENNKIASMHRMIMQAKPGQFIDHKNRNRLDNRKTNLRFCTISENSANKLSYVPTDCGYRGVRTEKFFSSFKYRAEFRPKGIKLRGPRRSTAEEAARDYDLMAHNHFGPFAVLNFPVES